MRFILLISLLFAAPAFAAGLGKDIQGDCHAFDFGFKGKYCIYRDSASKSQDVIYHFHGRFGAAEEYGEASGYNGQVREEWKAMGADQPVVVSVSLGPVWLLAEKNASPYSGMFEIMRDKVIPEIETGLKEFTGRRTILGESMGGFNGLQMALKTSLFSRAAILCAPIAMGVTPFSTVEEVNAMILKSTAYSYYGEKKRSEIDDRVGEMIAMGKAVFVTPEKWSGGDPLSLASTLDKAKPKVDFYLAAGFYDPFVLYEGNEELARVLRGEGYNVDWRPQWGGHCAMDIPSLARFLVQ